MFPLFGTGAGITKSCPAIQDGNGNYQKAFLLFGTATGNPKKCSRCSGTGIQGVPVAKYLGTGISAHACSMHYITHTPQHLMQSTHYTTHTTHHYTTQNMHRAPTALPTQHSLQSAHYTVYCIYAGLWWPLMTV